MKQLAIYISYKYISLCFMTLKTYSTSRSYIQVQPWGLIRINLTTRSYIKVLQKTSTLDLQTFPFQVNALAQLDLHDNLMGKIPFEPISHVKTLRILDLSNNRVEKVEDPFFSRETLKLDQLFLMDNSIETLPSNSFANFEFINYTTLSGNPLRIIEDGAFKVNTLLLIQDEKSSNHVMYQLIQIYVKITGSICIMYRKFWAFEIS